MKNVNSVEKEYQKDIGSIIYGGQMFCIDVIWFRNAQNWDESLFHVLVIQLHLLSKFLPSFL